MSHNHKADKAGRNEATEPLPCLRQFSLRRIGRTAGLSWVASLRRLWNATRFQELAVVPVGSGFRGHARGYWRGLILWPLAGWSFGGPEQYPEKPAEGD